MSSLTRGNSLSCGCINKTRNGKSKTPIGRLFHGIKSRCSQYNPERHLYFDKGIKVCDIWDSDFDLFESWCIENGYKKGLHIDRVDGDKGYYPENCRFVTPKINANNRFNTLYVEYKGGKWALKMLLQHLGKDNKYYTIYGRIKNLNWSVSDAINKPIKNIPKPIIQITKSNEIIKEFKSISFASKTTGIDCASINKCCNNKQKSSGGFLWRFK